MMERCSNCLGCRWIPFDKVKSQRFGENCPSVCYFNFNTYSARGKFQLAQAILDGDVNYTDRVTEAVFKCTSCGACDVGCKICRYNLEPLEHNIALKADAVEKGKRLPGQDRIMESLLKEQTMLPGMKKANRTAWSMGLEVKNVLSEPAETLFFPGCKYSYDTDLAEKARAMVSMLKNAGVDIGILGKADNCCGGRAFQMGFENEFEQRADSNIALIRKAGVKSIVTPCSDCYHSFKRLYAKLGLDVEVLHIVEYLDRLIASGKIKFSKPIDMTVTYHDPCHLGRLAEPYVPWEGEEKKIRNQIHTWDPPRPRYNGIYGVYDAPRTVLGMIPGIRFVEMERIREYAWCCGAGGGCSEIAEDFSDWTAAERICEAESTGANALVTACPWCESNFKKSIGKNGSGLKVYDIVDLVRMAL
jgi:Fe-S oxidoreductase